MNFSKRWSALLHPVENFLFEIREDIVVEQPVKEAISQIQEKINNNKASLKEAFSIFEKYLGKSEILKQKFGDLPSFKKTSNSEKAIAYLVRFYHQFKQMFIFQRHLYKITCLFEDQILHPDPNNAFKINENHNDLFFTELKEMKNRVVNVKSNKTEKFMLQHGFNCAAFRYLYSYMKHKNVRVYGKEAYGDMKLLESFNPVAEDFIRLCSIPGSVELLKIEPDIRLREMQKQRKEFSTISEFTRFQVLVNKTKYDLAQLYDQKYLASYFPSEFQSIIIEWIHKYITTTNDQTLLKLVCHRFSIDGNQLQLADFQFILNSAMALQSLCKEDPSFIFAIAASFPQDRLVDAFFYIRIESTWRRRIDPKHAEVIFKSIREIEKIHLKGLFGSKLSDDIFDEKLLIKILNMLKHASDPQLEKMNLSEWIDIAKHQKWSAIGDKIAKFGNMGYYFAYLDHLRHPAEKVLRKCFKEMAGFVMLEKLIARLIFLVSKDEIKVDEVIKGHIETLSVEIYRHTDWYLNNFEEDEKFIEKPFPLITHEKAQNEILSKLESKPSVRKVLEAIFPNNDRAIEEIKILITRQLENKNEQEIDMVQSEITSEWVKEMTEKLKDDENDVTKLINKFDDVLHDLRDIRLRDTQKFAIMNVVMSKKNLLAQVNTGEGKSYIIAAIAIIRAKRYGTVDIITSSSVLAQRDSQDLEKIYRKFDLSVGHNCSEDIEKRKLAYKSNIVYGDIARFQRDYLLHTFYKKNILGDRQRTAVVVDEVDNMLLDNGSNMLYLSHQLAGLEWLDSLFVFIQRLVYMPIFDAQLKKADLEAQFDSKVIKEKVMFDLFGRLTLMDITMGTISQQMSKNAWEKLIALGVINHEGCLNNLCDAKFNFIRDDIEAELLEICPKPLVGRIMACLKVVINRERHIHVPIYLHDFILLHLDEYIENCKRTMFLKHNVEYVIDVDHTKQDSDLQPKVTIIDQNTGVDLATSQWSEGLHQCVQLKHGCRLLPITLKAVFVSNVSYLKGYAKINGLSGTLGSIEEGRALADLYEAELIRIPTSKPKYFYEHVPIICTVEEEWIQQIYDEIKDQIKAERSVLIICQSIDDVIRLNEKLYDRYEELDVDDYEMSECINKMIIYQREFDEFNFNSSNPLEPMRLIISTNLAGRGTDINLNNRLKETGGLHVIITFLPENCRIEDQAYGRASRSGHPGSGQIISFIKENANEKPPSVFQLKEFRDNAEIHRLKSLKNFYEYHTEIEEKCLEKFRYFFKKIFLRSVDYTFLIENFPQCLFSFKNI